MAIIQTPLRDKFYLFLFLEVSVDVCGSVNRLERLFTAFHSHPLSWNTAFKFVAHEEFR